jgi:hypothetical protein
VIPLRRSQKLRRVAVSMIEDLAPFGREAPARC